MRAICEVVAHTRDDGEEVRLYAGGVLVHTAHLYGEERGKYVVGQEYEIEGTSASAHAPEAAPEAPDDGDEEEDAASDDEDVEPPPGD
jgi:hypothetical protein